MLRFIFLISLLFSWAIQAETLTYGINTEHSSGHVEEYVLGAGDMVRIVVYGSQDLNTEMRVSEVGTINFPLLGEIKVGGLSPAQAEQEIAKSLEKGGFVKQPHVNLVVVQYLSQFVSVLGDVYKPGRFPLDRASTLSDALALAGGITPNGSDMITLSRTVEGKVTKYNYDMLEMLVTGNSDSNPKVLNGDIIFVPKAPVFYIYGEVQRPGSFRLQRDMTVAQALSTGGGLTARGTERGIKVKRVNKDGHLHSFSAKLGDKLQENDIVVISESWF
jgi:polysaccharide export outer membrane protein